MSDRMRTPDKLRWDDLRIFPTAVQFVGVGDPILVNWTIGGKIFKVLAFQKDNAIYVTAQMPHGYYEGSNLFFHIHWTPKDRGTAESGNKVGWKVDYSIANIDETFSTSATADLQDTCSGTNDKHELTSSIEITGSGLTISHMLILKIYRSDTGTDDTWVGTIAAESPVLLEFDIHYQMDDRGSTTETTK